MTSLLRNRVFLGLVAAAVAVVMVAWLTGCTTASMVCPDGKSTVSYRGLSLMGATSVGCTCSKNGGAVASISGDNLIAIAAAVAPLIGPLAAMAAEPPARTGCP